MLSIGAVRNSGETGSSLSNREFPNDLIQMGPWLLSQFHEEEREGEVAVNAHTDLHVVAIYSIWEQFGRMWVVHRQEAFIAAFVARVYIIY